EDRARKIFKNYGFHEIRVPVVEHTDVFVRSIGENTDIVEKEMYTFNDRAGRSLTLRPEGTASVVRCYVQNGLYTMPAPQRYFYTGPMFRYERPQKGRFRQFYQIGAEAFGVDAPYIDAEILCMLNDFLSDIGLDGLNCEINSIGCNKCRPGYRQALKAYLLSGLDGYCEDCRRRYDINPLRVLDCKVPSCIEASSDAPVITDYLCDDCSAHFRKLRKYLDSMEIKYELNPRLVRGLDYYTGTTFEITTVHPGSQNAVVAGGRYDKLVEEFGGPSAPAVGFAIGMERLVELVSDMDIVKEPGPGLFLICLNEEYRLTGIRILRKLRFSGLWCEMGFGASSLRSQLKKADRAGARYVFIIGEDEIKAGRIKYRRLSNGEEGYLPLDDYENMARLISDERI
ncbi:MAG TPA: histidine--tRNA ligase, partial [Nitrospirae bacterium]|nr:histidine--tRNA ligase [Nitrospirota bacterium]